MVGFLAILCLKRLNKIKISISVTPNNKRSSFVLPERTDVNPKRREILVPP